MTKGRIALIVAIAALVAAFFVFDFGRFFSIDYFKSQQAAFDGFYRANPLLTAAVFFAIYVAVTGLSLPGAALMSLVAGAIFQLAWGTVIVSFASSIGATLAFLASRFLFRDWVQGRFGDKLRAINEGMAREGAFYLFTL
ncbi:MAG: pyridine nucleotide-disulfide oxidoreductase, partial [Burkholderiales bacterium]